MYNILTPKPRALGCPAGAQCDLTLLWGTFAWSIPLLRRQHWLVQHCMQRPVITPTWPLGSLTSPHSSEMTSDDQMMYTGLPGRFTSHRNSTSRSTVILRARILDVCLWVLVGCCRHLGSPDPYRRRRGRIRSFVSAGIFQECRTCNRFVFS